MMIDQSTFNIKGATSPRSMFVDFKTREVLGPSVPKNQKGVSAVWVEWVDGKWIEIRDRLKIKKIIKEKYPKNQKITLNSS